MTKGVSDDAVMGNIFKTLGARRYRESRHDINGVVVKAREKNVRFRKRSVGIGKAINHSEAFEQW